MHLAAFAITWVKTDEECTTHVCRDLVVTFLETLDVQEGPRLSMWCRGADPHFLTQVGFRVACLQVCAGEATAAHTLLVFVDPFVTKGLRT